MAITEKLEFDVSDAEDAIDKLDKSLGEAVQSFKVNLADAVDVLNGVEVVINEPDTTPITESVEAAIAAADNTPVTIEGQVDEASITDPIDAAVAAADSTVTIEADTSDAESAIGDLQSEIDSLGSSAGNAGSSLGGFSSGAEGIGVTAGLAQGSVSELTSSLGSLGPEAAAAGAGIAALGAATKTFFDAALEAQAAEIRFNDTTGAFGDAVKKVDIGGLNTDIQTLALSLGSSDEQVLQSISNVFQLGKSNGTAGEEITKTSQQIFALAANARATNPALGSVGDNIDGLSKGLANGGKFLAKYGIALTSNEITLRAQADTGGKAVDQLTRYDRAAAGAAIATERLGTSIRGNIDRGLQNPVIQLDALKESFSELLEAAGKPLVAPVIDILKASVPVAGSLATALGDVLQVLVPFISSVADSLSGPFAELGQAFGDLITEAQPLLKVFLGPNLVTFKVFGVTISLIAKALELLSKVIGPVADAIGFLGEQIADVVNAVKPLIGFISDLGDTLKNDLPTHLPFADELNKLAPVLGFLADHLGGVKDKTTAFTGALPLLESAASFSGTAVKDLGKNLKTTGDEIKNTKDTVDDSITKFEAYNKALKLTDSIGGDVAGTFKAATDGVGDQTQALEFLAIALNKTNLSTDSLQTIATGLGTSSDQLDSFVKAVTQDIQNMTDSATKNLPTVGGVIDDLEAKAKTAGTAFNPKDIGKEVEKQVATIGDFGDTLDFLVNNNLPRLAKLAAERGPEFAAALRKSIDSQDGFAQSLEAQLKTADESVLGFIDHFNTVIAPKIEEATGSAGLQAAAIFGTNLGSVTTFDSTKLENEATDAGKRAGTGLVLGLLDKGIKEEIKFAGTILGHLLLGSFADALGVHSPSTEAMKIGHFFNQGLILGLRSSGGDVVAEAERITKAAVDSASAAVSLNMPVSVPVAIAPVPATVSPAAPASTTPVVTSPSSQPLVGTLQTFTVDPIESAIEVTKKLGSLSRASGR